MTDSKPVLEIFYVPKELQDEELTSLLETVNESGETQQAKQPEPELEPGPEVPHDSDVAAPELVQRLPAAPEEPLNLEENDIGSPLQSLIFKFNKVAQESLDNFAEDRREIEQALQVIWKDLSPAIQNGKKRPRDLYQAYVELIKTKTNNNANVTKLLDSIARLLQAGRQNEIFSGASGDGGMSDQELTELLED